MSWLLTFCVFMFVGGRDWRLTNKCQSAPLETIKCFICGNQFTRTRNNPTQIYCSDECRHAADKFRKHQGRGNRGDWCRGKIFNARVPNTTCANCKKEFYKPTYYKKRGSKLDFCSLECRIRYCSMNPEYYPKTNTRRGRGGKREDLNNQYFRSSWEANYARYLNWLISIGEIKSWTYEPDTFEFVSIKRGCRFYTPDFKITEINGEMEYHEIKGYMDDRSRVKLARMAKYYPNIKVVLIDKDQYKALSEQLKTLIPNWENRQ